VVTAVLIVNLYFKSKNSRKMLRVVLKALFLFTSSNIINIEGATNQIVAKYISERDVYSSYETFSELSEFKCVDRCLRDFPSGQCKAAGYSKGTKTCRLSSNSDVTIRANDSTAGVYLLTFTGGWLHFLGS